MGKRNLKAAITKTEKDGIWKYYDENEEIDETGHIIMVKNWYMLIP